MYELEPDQAQRLVKITRSTRDRVRLRRAGIMLASVQGRPASEIAVMFAAKMERILDLYDHPPTDGRVLCVDEFGPLNLQPRPGHGWFRRGQPTLLRATYSRRAGCGKCSPPWTWPGGLIFYRFRDRKRWPQFLGFYKQLRRRFPAGTLYLVCDNYGPHGTAKVTSWCDDHDIELVFTPSNASCLNWIAAKRG